MPFAPKMTRGTTAFLALALAGFVAACTATADSGATTAPLRCEIALDAIPGGTRLSGMVTATQATHGSYEMQITSRSSGGSASIRQSGDFSAPAGHPTMIAETELTGSPASQNVALSIRVGAQRMSCANPAL
jgi:hypothetical protein